MISLLLYLAASTSPDFRIADRVDPLTDHRSVWLEIAAGNTGLMVGCPDTTVHSFRIAAIFPQYVGRGSHGTDMQEINYRFDKAPAVRAFWSARGNVMASDSFTSFIREMKGSRSLFMRAIDYKDDPIDASFSYPDPAAAVDEVLDRCGYTPDLKYKKAD